MQPQPLVTAITVVRNGERFLRAALESLRRQTYPPYEIIVVDGQSSDNTAAIARSVPGVKYIVQPDTGLAQARNLGIAAARGDLIAFLDHDDLWHPDKLALQVALHNASPAPGYTLTWMVFQREPGAAIPAGTTEAALLARRELFSQYADFDPRFSIGCDAEWFTRMRDLGVPVAVVPMVLLYKRLHESNLSRNSGLNRREMFMIARESIDRQRDSHTA